MPDPPDGAGKLLRKRGQRAGAGGRAGSRSARAHNNQRSPVVLGDPRGQPSGPGALRLFSARPLCLMKGANNRRVDLNSVSHPTSTLFCGCLTTVHIPHARLCSGPHRYYASSCLDGRPGGAQAHWLRQYFRGCALRLFWHQPRRDGYGGLEGAGPGFAFSLAGRHALQRKGAAGAVPAASRAGGRAGHAEPQEGQRAEAAAGEAGGQFPLLFPDGRGRAHRSPVAGALQSHQGRAQCLLHQFHRGPGEEVPL